LRVVEVVVFISLVLNVVQGFMANHSNNKMQNQIDGAKAESGAR
jgi:hypothetical protein